MGGSECLVAIKKGLIAIPSNGRIIKISKIFSKIFRKFCRTFSKFFRSFCRFLRFAVRSKFFEKIDLLTEIFLALKSSKSELSLRFSSHLKFSQALEIFLAVLKLIQAERN